MKTLVLLALLAVGGIFLANAARHEGEDLVRGLKDDKESVTAALKSEKDRAAAAIKDRLKNQKERAAAAVKDRLKNQKERAAAALSKRTPPIPDLPSSPQTEAAPTAMSEAAFWKLTSETRTAAGNDTGRQSELLKERLAQLPAQSIIEFERIHDGLDERAYTWDLWGAAYVIQDGCSDVCFRDFRSYLISLGSGPYEAALQNPDSLAAIAQDAEKGSWENAADVAPDAYSSVTGGDFPFDDADLSGSPGGTAFDENDEAGLARRYPRLFARFR
jgi:hypothetical protein